jgi:hypothetical protein
VTRFDLLPYVAIALWLAPFVITAAALTWGIRKDRREARETFGCDGPVQRALLSLMRDEARR